MFIPTTLSNAAIQVFFDNCRGLFSSNLTKVIYPNASYKYSKGAKNKGGVDMSVEREAESIPGGQVFMDNILLLLVLGVVVPTLIYTVWGLYEIFSLPTLPLVP